MFYAVYVNIDEEKMANFFHNYELTKNKKSTQYIVWTIFYIL